MKVKPKIKILIVEDEALEAKYIQIILKELGYEFCAPVATGRDAIESAARENPDVILMDIRLVGRLDGIDAAREILAHRPVPIIFMTGYALEEIRARAVQLNPAGFLEKPVTREDIKSIIDALF